ncbi:MAG: Jag N-terminal domain-containing protein, partial [Spirochaetia bacterium]
MTREFEGKTEKDAIDAAIAELGLERDEFDVEIVDTQKSGLFGMSKKVR